VSARFPYLQFDEQSFTKRRASKELFEQLEEFLESSFVNSRRKSIIFTKLEEAYLQTQLAIHDEVCSRQAEAGETDPSFVTGERASE
jgi:hypothetical protein